MSAAYLYKLSLIFLLFVVSTNINAQNRIQQEFELKELQNKQRIQDFYIRLNELERLDERRQRGALTQREMRKSNDEKYEKSRQEYIKNRKNKPELDPNTWESQEKERRAKNERIRQEYVKQRDELNLLMRRISKFSEEEEFDLFPYEEEAE